MLIQTNAPMSIMPGRKWTLNGYSGLKTAIDKYLAEEPTSKFWQNFKPSLCSWHEVLREIERARLLYIEKGRNNPVRRYFRHGSGISRNLIPLLDGIPQDDGLGLLKGAFKIIFTVSMFPSELSIERLRLVLSVRFCSRLTSFG